MRLNEIYNESCIKTMQENIDEKSIDVILTSPFYNTNRHAGKKRIIDLNKDERSSILYDVHVDNLTNEEYCDFTIDLFNGFDMVLKQNGVVLYNMSYSAENSECMFRAIASVVEDTNFEIADTIIWKKRSARPNNESPNRLTRTWEFVFAFCRKGEYDTFYHTNLYDVDGGSTLKIVNAKNNDGFFALNRATYSTDLCMQLLGMFAPKDAVVYDPFMGSGTTAVACKMMGLKYLGSEISENQIAYAKERIANTYAKSNIFDEFFV